MASFFSAIDPDQKCFICLEPVTEDGLYHDGAEDRCLAHRFCATEWAKMGSGCAACKAKLNLQEILTEEFQGTQNLLSRAKVQHPERPNAETRDADDQFAQRLQEEEDLAAALELSIREVVPENQEVEDQVALPLEQQPTDFQELPVIHLEEPVVQPPRANRGVNRACCVVSTLIVGVAAAALSYLNAS